MANLTQIELPNGTTYDIEDASKSGVYTVIGTQTAATASWTGNLHGVSALFDGLTINYYLPYNGVSGTNVTLNLTLDNGTTTGAVNCYLTTSRLVNHYGAGRVITMTYYSAGSISVSGTATTDNRWICDAYYDSNDQAYYVRRYYNSLKAGANKIFPFSIIMQCSDDRWESIVTSSSTGTGKSRNTHGFRLGQILFMYANTTYDEDANVGNQNIWDQHTGTCDARYSFNVANNATYGLTAKKPIYIVGTINSSDGLFYLDATWWTQTLPSTADGKLYIYIGDAYDYYRFDFVLNHVIYHYTNGAVRQFSQDAATVNGLTVQTAVPSSAVFTDTTYSMTRDGESVKLTPSSGTAQSITLSSLINGLGEGTSPAQGNDYLVAQYAGGGTTNTTYYRRKVSNIVNATNVKAALGTGSSTTTYLNNAGNWATPPDTKNTAGSTDTSSKIFLIGATSQAANPQTYSDNEVYATSGVLTTKSVQIGGGSCTMQYNTTTQSCDFVFT